MTSATTIASAAEMAELASLFQVREDITFLNHGSFGACPLPVFETFQNWQRELERQPVEFLGRRVKSLLAEARGALGEFVGTDAANVVFVPNVTAGMNAVARSLRLEPGDEILATDHEYGAVDRTWRYYCARSGAAYINQPIALPLTDAATFVEQLWAGVTPRTKIIAISHITSGTALIFPIAEVCRLARAPMIVRIPAARARRGS
jgi:isopenicillin-N epimerase